MDAARSHVRVFAVRYVIAFLAALVLMTGAVIAVNRRVDDKIDRIPRIALRTAPPPPQGANYLLIGSDSRAFVHTELEQEAFGDSATEAGQRSDTIMVVHVEPSAQRTLVVSFPRDLWVSIPGHGYQKINAAFNYGAQTVIDTLKANFDIDINYYIELDFISFVGLVNEIGTVPTYVPYAARDAYTGLDLDHGGCWNMDGEVALQWVRARSLQYRNDNTGQWVYADIVPDIGRIGRQQSFMRQLAGLAVAKSLDDPFAADSIADRIVNHLHASENFDKQAVFALIDAFRTINPDDTSALEFQTFPWRTGPNQGAQQVLYADMSSGQALIERLRNFDTQPARPVAAPSSVRLRIKDASVRPGIEIAAMKRFEELGFVNAGTGYADKIRDTTQVRYAPGALDKGKLVLRYLYPDAALVADPTLLGADVEVDLGASFQEIVVPADAGVIPTTASSEAPAPGETSAPAAAGTATPAPTPTPAPAPTPISANMPPPAPRDGC